MKLKIIFFPLTLVIAFVVFVFMIKPQWEDLASNNAELDAVSEKRDTLQSGRQNLQKALGEYGRLSENDRQLVVNAVPAYKNNDDFIAEIYKNMQGSGAFLVGADLKEVKNKIRKECMAGNIAQTEVPNENYEMPYCPLERVSTNSTVEIVGSYQNLKDFVKLVDNQNRLTVPTKTILERLENSSGIEEGSGQPEPGGNLVKGILQFDFFNKDVDEGIMLSNAVESNDKILSSLLLGSVNTQALDAFKDSITSDVFKPVSVSEWGKDDLFAK